MFWRKKKEEPPPLKSAPPSLKEEQSSFSDAFRKEMRRELEAVGDGKSPDVVTAGIGMIKMGAKELLPGWLGNFGKAEVFIVSIGRQPPENAFVFGPSGDRNYFAVFTRLDLVDQCMREMAPLDTAMAISGIKILEVALRTNRGVWLNPLSEACSVKFPASAIGRLLEEAQRA